MSATTFVLKRAGDSATARRAEHFFTETARVAEGAALWEAGDIAAFGQLMNASGRSSAHNYEARANLSVCSRRCPLSCMPALLLQLLCAGLASPGSVLNTKLSDGQLRRKCS